MIFFIAVTVKDNKESFLSHIEAHFLDGIQNINAHNQQLKAAQSYTVVTVWQTSLELSLK